jgi:hypothetical protein
MANVNSLFGYLVGNDGREVFPVLPNAAGFPSSYVRAASDEIVRALAA